MNGQDQQQPSILVIGYGNPLCGDDKVGQQAALEVARWGIGHVSALALHQLTPELAATLAEYDEVIFIDAVHDSKMSLQPIEPQLVAGANGHTCDPQGLLALADRLYGHRLRAWWLTIPTAEYGLGAPLSSVAQEGLEDALHMMRSLFDTDMEMMQCTK